MYEDELKEGETIVDKFPPEKYEYERIKIGSLPGHRYTFYEATNEYLVIGPSSISTIEKTETIPSTTTISLEDVREVKTEEILEKTPIFVVPETPVETVKSLKYLPHWMRYFEWNEDKNRMRSKDSRSGSYYVLSLRDFAILSIAYNFDNLKEFPSENTLKEALDSAFEAFKNVNKKGYFHVNGKYTINQLLNAYGPIVRELSFKRTKNSTTDFVKDLGYYYVDRSIKASETVINSFEDAMERIGVSYENPPAPIRRTIQFYDHLTFNEILKSYDGKNCPADITGLIKDISAEMVEDIMISLFEALKQRGKIRVGDIGSKETRTLFFTCDSLSSVYLRSLVSMKEIKEVYTYFEVGNTKSPESTIEKALNGTSPGGLKLPPYFKAANYDACFPIDYAYRTIIGCDNIKENRYIDIQHKLKISEVNGKFIRDGYQSLDSLKEYQE